MILLRITVNNDRFYIFTFRVVHYADGEIEEIGRRGQEAGGGGKTIQST